MGGDSETQCQVAGNLNVTAYTLTVKVTGNVIYLLKQELQSWGLKWKKIRGFFTNFNFLEVGSET